MSYLVIARKFRPQRFCEVSGQEHVTRTLANSIRRERVAHAYLFAGPRGVGKTSIARIFAKALNCKEPIGAPQREVTRDDEGAGGRAQESQGVTIEPCGACTNCLEIAGGSNIAVREIDGASHNSVDNVRDLIDSFRGLPPPGSRYKVYIIDEVHMFSTAAFNALLKSLEEPPPNTVFILATTEAHKIPDTVISRCQRHDFRSLSLHDIELRLRVIADEERMQVEPEALQMVARLSDGSMRDAQSLLERVNSFCDGAISAANASVVLGTVERAILARLSQAVLAREAGTALDLVAEVFSKGVDPALFSKDFATHFRELLIARFGGDKALTNMGLGEADRVELLRQAGSVSEQDVQDLAHLARQGCDAAVRSLYPKYALEALVVRMATREPTVVLAEMLAAMQQGKGLTGPVSGNVPGGERGNAERGNTGRGNPESGGRSGSAGLGSQAATRAGEGTKFVAATPSRPAQGQRDAGVMPRMSTGAAEQGLSEGERAGDAESIDSQEDPAGAPPSHQAGVDGRGGVKVRELDWPEFVNDAQQQGSSAGLSRMLIEHLRRLSVERFAIEAHMEGSHVDTSQDRKSQGASSAGAQRGSAATGVLEASGAVFSIESLNQNDAKRKLQEALHKFSTVGHWKISLKAVSAERALLMQEGASFQAPQSVSLIERERAEQTRTRAAKKSDITNHPRIKDLQKIFPGTEIEAITMKED